MTIDARIQEHNDIVQQEQERCRREVKHAIAILGIREVISLCARHADLRSKETANRESKARWVWVYRKLQNAIGAMKP